MRSSRRSDLHGWLLAGPAVLLFALFVAYPLVAGVGLAFFEQAGPDFRYVGLDNFRALFAEEPLRQGVLNTLGYVVICVPCIVFLPLGVALLAHGFRKLGVFVAFAFYLPTLSTAPILALVWRWLFEPEGFFNGLLGALGIPFVLWLGSVPQSFYTMCLIVVAMNLGGYTVLYLVAERNIPTVLFEIAEVDGCSAWQRARYVLVPSMLPTVAAVAVMATIGMFQVWVIPFMITGGGPLYSTTTVVLDLYNNAWSYGRIGMASAEGVLLMLAIAVVALVQARYVWRAI